VDVSLIYLAGMPFIIQNYKPMSVNVPELYLLGKPKLCEQNHNLND